ncbi:MAG TPA: DUF5615 family PIN-like protein [Euzebyales bacterium]|nr:DUF5615 family PIN-like protein [Euzebyales bacterium]
MRLLIDQMFPHATCELLNDRGHDAVHVRDRGVDVRPDAEVVAVAAAEERVIVTENVKDFAGVHRVTVLCVLTSRLPPQGMHVHLAELLDKWAMAHPKPYLGLHWPP